MEVEDKNNFSLKKWISFVIVISEVILKCLMMEVAVLRLNEILLDCILTCLDWVLIEDAPTSVVHTNGYSQREYVPVNWHLKQ